MLCSLNNQGLYFITGALSDNDKHMLMRPKLTVNKTTKDSPIGSENSEAISKRNSGATTSFSLLMRLFLSDLFDIPIILIKDRVPEI